MFVRRLLDRGWRYTLIGALCAVSNYIIMLAVDAAGGHYLVGTLVAFAIVTPVAYLLHSRFTFAEPFSFRAFSRFVAGGASTYPIAAGTLIILCSGLHFSVAVAAPVAAVFMFGWNFAAAHWSIMPSMRLAGRTSGSNLAAGELLKQ